MKKAWKWASFSLLLLALTACQREAAPSPSASPTPSPAVEPTPVPTESPETDRTLPALFAENGRWMVYLDDWVYTEADGSVMELSFHDRAGVCRQTLQTFSESIGPQQPGFAGPQSGTGTFATLTDLNFDGIEDLRLNDFQFYYKAFLWDRDLQRFVEQPTFSSIPRPYPMDGLIFGCGSSGASNTYYSAYTYDYEAGYQLIRFLNIEIVSLPDNDYQPLYTEWYYENGELTDTVETEEDLSYSDFWQEYVEYCNQYVWG